jgi:serine phosphatase RsbU (regulator of sigma subunit)
VASPADPFESDEIDLTVAVSLSRGPELAPAPPGVFGNYLVTTAGPESGKRVEIGATPVTIGRDAKQTLVFDDTKLSRVHARVSLVNGEVVAEDLNSTNGTFVDGTRITAPVPLREGQVLRMGGQLITYERRNRREIDRAEELDRDLLKASNYVFSLLPEPLTTGLVRAEWRFVPSAQLGGDAFGYYWLDQSTFVFYLVDVSGHGAGSAMHSVSVMNVLRQRALPDVDFRNPAAVLTSLNARFPMDAHGGLFFTMWYGVYDAGDRTLRYASAGHHPAYLVPPDRQAAHPLGMSASMVGAFPGYDYKVQQVVVPADGTLYLFSDGVFEISTKDERRWDLSHFLPLLLEPAVPGTPEAERLHRAVTHAAGTGQLDDDFSLMVVTFP